MQGGIIGFINNEHSIDEAKNMAQSIGFNNIRFKLTTGL